MKEGQIRRKFGVRWHGVEFIQYIRLLQKYSAS